MIPTALVNESFNLTNIGVVVFLTHSLQGLPRDTMLTSKTGKQWSVHARILLEMITEEHRLFDNESYEYMLIRFKSVEDKKQTIQRIIKEELQGKFQYLLKQVGHSDKPEEGETLCIE